MDIKISYLANDEILSLRQLQIKHDNKFMLIDFWHTKCTRCPAALEKLNTEAATSNDILYVSCALSQGPGNKEVAAELAADWENMEHAWMDVEDKELAKAAFGFAAVPYYVFVGKNGIVLATGDPKSVDYSTLLKQSVDLALDK